MSTPKPLPRFATLVCLAALLASAFTPLPVLPRGASQLGFHLAQDGSSHSLSGSGHVYLPIVVTQDPALILPPGNPIEILTNSTAFVDGFDTLHILGEVANHSSGYLSDILVGVKVLDGAGQVVAADAVYTHLDSLAAGDRTCFEIDLLAPQGGAGYQFDDPSYTTGGVNPNLSIHAAQGVYDPDTGWYDVTGEVRNDSSHAITDASAVASLYDAAGLIVGCDFAYVDSLNLAAGQSSLFDITFIQGDTAGVLTYRVQPNGAP